MTIRIRSNCPVSNRTGAFVFVADDDQGVMEIWVTPTRWEQLWLDGLEPTTDEDRLDFALGMLKYAASEGEASVDTAGTRIRFVG